ncbi:substrate-binding periplasmic protein [Pseudomonas abietaniphila]
MVRYNSWWLMSGAAIILIPSLAFCAGTCSHLTATGNAEYPPYLWRDPQDPTRLIGANADLVKHVGAVLGLKVDVLYAGPWSRAQDEVRSGRIDMLAGYFMTSERARILNFISPPFLFTSSMIWLRRGNVFPYRNWSDLVGHSGGTLVSNSYGQSIDDYASANLTLEAVPTAIQAFEKLILKRNDFVVFEQYPGLALTQKLGVAAEVVALEPPVSSEGLYLALSANARSIDRTLREAITFQMQGIATGPLPQVFLKSNLELWRAQQRIEGIP